MTTIKELKELEAKATSAPWTVEEIWAQECGCGHAVKECKGTEYSEEFKVNNRLIETTRNALPELIRVIELAEDSFKEISTLRKRADDIVGMVDAPHEKALNKAVSKANEAISEIRKLKGE